MSWLEKLLDKKNIINTRKASIPEGVWTKCPSCDQVLYRIALKENLEVSPKCQHHLRMSARHRLDSFLDKGERIELASEYEPKDLLNFKDKKRYKERLALSQKYWRERCVGRNERRAVGLTHRGLRVRVLFHGWLDGVGCGCSFC